jgi:hypothetical protein
MADALEALPEPERIAAQAKAPAMIAEFLASKDPKVVGRRHPFAFFVQEWGGLRVPKRDGANGEVHYRKLTPIILKRAP